MTPQVLAMVGATLLAGGIAAVCEALEWRVVAWVFCGTQAWFLAFARAALWEGRR